MKRNNKKQSFPLIMKYNLKLDDDTVDGLVCAVLKESIDIAKEEIKHLKKMKKVESHNKEDLADCILNLDAMETVYNYFGGNIK